LSVRNLKKPIRHALLRGSKVMAMAGHVGAMVSGIRIIGVDHLLSFAKRDNIGTRLDGNHVRGHGVGGRTSRSMDVKGINV
jgi:hypothetical protein